MTSSQTTAHEFDLGFTLVECEGCQTERAAGVECPTCGLPPELDPHVERRKATLASPIGLLAEAPNQSAEPLQFDPDLLGAFSEWLDSLLRHCALAAEGEDVGRDLEAIIRRLLQLDSSLAATPRYRPYLWHWTLIADLVAQLRSTAEAYFSALTTPSPERARRFAERAQSGIDHAAALVHESSRRLDRWNKIEAAPDDDPMSVLIAIADAEAHAREHHDDPLAADETARDLHERVTGSRDCPPWLALGLKLTDIQVDPLLDRERFWECAALTYQRVATSAGKGRGDLARVASSANWAIDLQEVHKEMFEIGCEVRALAPQFDRPNVLARSLVRVGHQIAERCAPALLATVIAAYRGRVYEELAAKDIGALLSEAEDIGLQPLLFGIDRAMRHADAHKLFAVTRDGVTFSADKREYDHLTWEQLEDRVLGGWESVMALTTGILCALEVSGVPGEAMDPIGYVDAPLDGKIRFVLAVLGWSDVTVLLEEGRISIRGKAPEAPKRLRFLGYLGPYLPRGIRLEVNVAADAEEHTWAGPVEGMEVFGTSASEEVKQAAILRILATWTQDGKPLVSPAQRRKVAAVHAMQWTSAKVPFDTRIRNVTLIQDVAKVSGDAELTGAVGKVLQGLRLMASGRRPWDWEATVDRLSHWATVDVPSPAILEDAIDGQ